MALLGIGIALSIVIIASCGYVFERAWTGLTKPRRTFWDWLNLLVVPIVLALGGYLFNRSESWRTQDVTDQQRAVDHEIADERRQDDVLQAYLEGISQLLTKDSIRHVAEADERYLRAIQRQENLGSAADSETVLMFAADIREARTEFLLTLEALYRGEDVPPANDGPLASRPSRIHRTR